jgi:hypothetical protein
MTGAPHGGRRRSGVEVSLDLRHLLPDRHEPVGRDRYRIDPPANRRIKPDVGSSWSGRGCEGQPTGRRGLVTMKRMVMYAVSLSVVVLSMVVMSPMVGSAVPDDQLDQVQSVRTASSVGPVTSSSVTFTTTGNPIPVNAAPLVVPAAAFSSRGAYDSGDYNFSTESGYLSGTSVAATCLQAPVPVPDGSRISYLDAYVYDNSGGTTPLEVHLHRTENLTGATDLMAYVISATQSASPQRLRDATVSHPDVGYPAYGYYLDVCLSGSGHRLYSVVIGYVP